MVDGIPMTPHAHPPSPEIEKMTAAIVAAEFRKEEAEALDTAQRIEKRLALGMESTVSTAIDGSVCNAGSVSMSGRSARCASMPLRVQPVIARARWRVLTSQAVQGSTSLH